MNILRDILQFLPWCWFVNMSFDLLDYLSRTRAWVRRCNAPIDGGYVLKDGYRLLGNSTTWLGLLQALVLGIIGMVVLPKHFLFLLALLVWAGHMVGSFIKRRLGIPRGGYLPLIDHGDYSLLAGGVMYALGRVSFAAWALAVLVTLLATPFVTFVAHRIGIRSRPI